MDFPSTEYVAFERLPVQSIAERKRRKAARMRAWRAQDEVRERPECRAVDRSLVLAFGQYLRDLPAAEATRLVEVLTAHARAGLEREGYDKRTVKISVARRVSDAFGGESYTNPVACAVADIRRDRPHVLERSRTGKPRKMATE